MQNNKKKDFIEGKHYYLDGTRVVFTALYLFERGYCCANRCLHCPYTKPHQKGNEKLSEEFFYLKDSQ